MKAVGYTEQLPIENERSLIDLQLPKPEPAGRDLIDRGLSASRYRRRDRLAAL